MNVTRLVRPITITIALLLSQACSEGIEIVGEGDVKVEHGVLECLLQNMQQGEDSCRKNVYHGKYLATYEAVPNTDWQFRRWGNYCLDATTNKCTFDILASTIPNFSGRTASPLQAIFRSTVNNGLTTLLIGDDFFKSLAAGVDKRAIDAGFHDHGSTLFVAENERSTPQAFWDDVDARDQIQKVLNTGEVQLLGLTFDSASPAPEGYRKWMDYALEKNPDTRFFISAQWEVVPSGVSSAGYAAEYQNVEAQVHALVEELRLAYPGLDIYCLPSGRGAVELYTLYRAGKLADFDLVGDSSKAIFRDNQGNPGQLLVELGELLWFGAIYNAPLPNDTDVGLDSTIDLKSVARTILQEHGARYSAPPDVDSDTDNDSTPDRLDPNPSGKPNILLIVADDLGYNDLAINNNNTQIHTPNMDQIARDGVRFTRHYAASVCSPARAALLTGIYPERLGFLPDGRGISPEVITLPERLRQEGYATWHIGKWHIGDLTRGAWPDRQGFDHWFGFLNQDRLAGTRVNGVLRPSNPRYVDPWLEGDNSPGRTYQGHLENILTDKALYVLSELNSKQTPWFLNLWFFAPHGPIQPAAEFAAKYPNTKAGKYLALVNQLDSNIGKVVSHLETIGALHNTIIVVVSDNGGTNAALDNNAPYLGGKTTLWEGGLRTPLMIRWPDESLNRQVFSDTISILDIYPTLLASIGSPTPENLDGANFYSSIQRLEAAPRKDLFWESSPPSYSILTRDGRWRYYNSPMAYGLKADTALMDLELDPSGSKRVAPIPLSQATQLGESYNVWYRDVHTVNTVYTQAANGSGILTGMDFLRTPGFGPYTFGVGFSEEVQGQIAAQPGIWDISRTGNTVTAQFGKVSLTGEFKDATSCHSIVVSGIFHMKTLAFTGADRISLNLYLDGELAQSAQMETALTVDDPTIETLIGTPDSPRKTGTILPPVIMNTLLDKTTPWTLESFSEDLCGAL